MYSLIKTARANECEPYSYPIHIFEQLPRVGSLSACEALLHWNVRTPDLRRFCYDTNS